MNRLTKTLGVLAAGISLAIAGCNDQTQRKPCRMYKIERLYTRYGGEFRYPATYNQVISPARDSSSQNDPERFMIISEGELREIGLNPDNEIEYDRKFEEEQIEKRYNR